MHEYTPSFWTRNTKSGRAMAPPTSIRKCRSTLGVLVKSAWDGGNALKFALRAPCVLTSPVYRIRPTICTARAGRPMHPHRWACFLCSQQNIGRRANTTPLASKEELEVFGSQMHARLPPFPGPSTRPPGGTRLSDKIHKGSPTKLPQNRSNPSQGLHA